MDSLEDLKMEVWVLLKDLLMQIMLVILIQGGLLLDISSTYIWWTGVLEINPSANHVLFYHKDRVHWDNGGYKGSPLA